MIRYSYANISKPVKSNTVKVSENKYTFEYPCESTFDCTDYIIHLPRGTYKFELYGASGGSSQGNVSSYRFPTDQCILDETVHNVGGNTICLRKPNVGGAGAYISGIITLNKDIISYATIGGKGQFKYKIQQSNNDDCYLKNNMIEGGYGGGGYSSNFFYSDSDFGSGSGGGQTAVKFEVNDLWHRVIVSGAGGGSDDKDGTYGDFNDGSGGAGGIIGQGWFSSGIYNFNYTANSTSGFSFGYGESVQKYKSLNPKGVQSYYGGSDRAGAGSGWFGGFASHDSNAGSGGGSSWVLSKDAIIPQGKIEAFDSFYQSIGKYEYAFTKSDYLFEHIFHTSGVWEGNGKLIITILNHCIFNTKFLCYRLHIFNLFLFSISIYES